MFTPRALAYPITVAILLAACAGQQQAGLPAATAPPARTVVATVAPSPTAVPSPTPAPTSAPSPTTVPSPTTTPLASATPTSQIEALAGQALVSALRQGGYVIFFRHAATDMTQTDSDLSRCETQRNLNAQGRADARAIGAAFRALGIPIGQVLSSGYCRARDTAHLAFGRAELARDLSGLPATQREQRAAALRKLLATEPEAGTNTVLVSHGFNITAAAEISIGEGEAAIFAPESDGAFSLVARVGPKEWSALAD